MATRGSKPAPEGRNTAAYHLENQVGYLLRRAHQRATAVFQERIGDAQITPTQFAALVKLHDEGELSQNHLGRRTAMDPATIQGVIQRLRQRALIDDRTDPGDRRRTLLRLTAEGRALIAGLIPNGTAVSRAILEPLSEAERRAFLAALRRLG
jgi:DNA-binding MarR family transcriptional regulator